MEYVRFSDIEAAILYCIPKPGAELSSLIWCYTFINRAAPPPHAVLESCLSKAVRAGVLTISPDGDYFICVNDDWYERIHQFDGTAANEIESMLQLEETVLLPVEWEAVKPGFTLPLEDYNRAVRRARHETDIEWITDDL